MTIAATIAEGRINARWPLLMTPDRVEFHRARERWEAGRLAHCAERIGPGMTVYDIGAECGDFTALYRTWTGPSGTVVPVEPQPAYWPAIRAHWEANGAGAPEAWFPGFAGAETTVHDFGVELAALGWPVADWPTCSIGPIQPDFGFRHLAQQAASTPQVRLDAFADLTGVVPDVIVMDIEGAEVECLRGCEFLLRDRRPLVYVSWHAGPALDWYGSTLADMTGLMWGFDYDGIELPHNGEAETFWFFEPR